MRVGIKTRLAGGSYNLPLYAAGEKELTAPAWPRYVFHFPKARRPRRA